jgi:hypothetical protein
LKILVIYFESLNFLENNAFYILNKKNELFFKKLNSPVKSYFNLEYIEFYLYLFFKFFFKKKIALNHHKISNPDFVYVHQANLKRLEIAREYLDNHHIKSKILFSDFEMGNIKNAIVDSILNKRHSVNLNFYFNDQKNYFFLQNFEIPISKFWIINYKKLINLSICHLEELFVKSKYLDKKITLLKEFNYNTKFLTNFKNYISYVLRLISQKNSENEFDVFFYQKNNPIKIKTHEKYRSADPFLISHDSTHFIFFEEINNKLGHISLVKIKKETSEYIGVIIKENFHLSFPFVFKSNDRYFMIPESCNDKSLRLYESINFPIEWKFKMKLMEDVDLADSIIIQSNGIYFILTSERIEGYHNSYKIFFSKNLESRSWKPHKLNPIMVTSYSRNAGMFFDKGKIILVFQQYGFNSYGDNVKFYQLNELTTSSFHIKKINKDQFIKHDTVNTHHFVKNDVYRVFDKKS